MLAVSFEIKSKMHELSSKVMSLKKHMWQHNRKAHRRCIAHFDKFKEDIASKCSYYIMQDPEVTPARAEEVCTQALTYVDAMIERLFVHPAYKELEDHMYYIMILKDIKKELNALIVMIKISDHEKSFWVQ